MPREEEFLISGHRLTLESRGQLSVSGVTEVGSFDETAAVLETAQGTLVVRGSELHMDRLDLESGEVRLKGTVDSLIYEENARSRGSFFERLFR